MLAAFGRHVSIAIPEMRKFSTTRNLMKNLKLKLDPARRKAIRRALLTLDETPTSELSASAHEAMMLKSMCAELSPKFLRDAKNVKLSYHLLTALEMALRIHNRIDGEDHNIDILLMDIQPHILPNSLTPTPKLIAS